MVGDSYYQSSKKQDWATPIEFINWAVEEGVMCQPTFDVAAAPHNAKAPKYFTKEDNALIQSWPSGVLFCNPPFGNELKLFISKALDELWAGPEKMEVWFLIPARVDTIWFHELVWPNAEEIYFIRGRLNFLEHGKEKKANATFPNMLVRFLGPNSRIKWDGCDPIVSTLEPPLDARGQ